MKSSLDNRKNQSRNIKCCTTGLSASQSLYLTKPLEDTDGSSFPMSNHAEVNPREGPDSSLFVRRFK